MLFSERPLTERAVEGVVLSMVLSSCGGCSGGDSVAETSRTQDEIAQVGVVEGTVRLAEGEEPPSYPYEKNVNQPDPPNTCPRETEEDRRPLSVAADRGLTGAVVGAAEFKGKLKTTEPRSHKVSIDRCRLSPNLVVATRGDSIQLTNGTNYPYIPKLGAGTGGEEMMPTLLHEEQRDIPLELGGVLQLGCGFAAPCGRTDVVVYYHPVHTVTEEGKFRLEGVPVGDAVEIHAFHPLLGEVKKHVKVQPGKVTRVDFVLKSQTASATSANDSLAKPG